MTRRAWTGAGLAALGGAAALPFLARGVRHLAATRGAVTTYARLIAASNAGDLLVVRGLCSAGYLRDRPLELAREGGVVGFPRQVHPNFRAWVEGGEVWLCGGNRVGTVVRFVREGDGWKYDGPVGFLGPDGRVVAVGADRGARRQKP